MKRNTILNAVALAFFFLLSYLLCFCCSKLFFFLLSIVHAFPSSLFCLCIPLYLRSLREAWELFLIPLFFFFCFCFSLHSKPTDWTLLLLKSRLNGLAFNQRHSLFFVVFRRCFFSQHSKLLWKRKDPKGEHQLTGHAHTHTQKKNRRNVCSNCKRERQRKTKRMPADS